MKFFVNWILIYLLFICDLIVKMFINLDCPFLSDNMDYSYWFDDNFNRLADHYSDQFSL